MQPTYTTYKDLPNAINGFYMPKNLYKDLASQATWKHNALSEEIRLRLNDTLNLRYRV